MCWPYTDRLSADHTVLSSHVALTYDNSIVGQQQLHQEHQPRIWQQKLLPAGYVQPAAVGAPAACVGYGALSRYTVARPVEQQIIDRRMVFDHDDYRSIANGCWLITSARVYCQCGCPIYRHIHEEMAPDYFCKFTGKTRVPKQCYIDFGDNFNFGELVCRRV